MASQNSWCGKYRGTGIKPNFVIKANDASTNEIKKIMMVGGFSLMVPSLLCAPPAASTAAQSWAYYHGKCVSTQETTTATNAPALSTRTVGGGIKVRGRPE